MKSKSCYLSILLFSFISFPALRIFTFEGLGKFEKDIHFKLIKSGKSILSAFWYCTILNKNLT